MNTITHTETAQSRAGQAFDSLTDSVGELQHEVGPMLDRAGGAVGALASRSLKAVKDGSLRLQDQALRASDQSARIIRNEPLKSVMIAALAGGLLVALLGLSQRLRDRR